MSTSKQHEPRRRARRRALQALYQWSMTGRDAGEIIVEFFEEQDFSNVDRELFSTTVRGVSEQSESLLTVLDPHLDRPAKHLDLMERVILLMGAHELQNDPGTPATVIVNECVELARVFGAEQGHGFVNAVLDGLAKAQRAVEFKS